MTLFKTSCDLEGYNGNVGTQTNKPKQMYTSIQPYFRVQLGKQKATD